MMFKLRVGAPRTDLFDAIGQRIYREDLELFRAAEPFERRASPRQPVSAAVPATGRVASTARRPHS